MRSPISTLAAAAALQARAERRGTPCGPGELVWHCWGPGRSRAGTRPVVLLHGGSGSWNHWVRNIDALLDSGRQVIVPDLPGFGDSACPDGLNDADGQLPWLEQGLQQLLGDAAVDLVGFSFGGLASGLWAAAHPRRVAHLVLVGAPALSAERLPPLPLQLWERAAPGPARDAAHRHNLRTLMLARDDSVDELAVALHAANLPRDRLRRRRLMLSDALARTLPALGCAVSGIWGELDVLYRHRLPLIGQVLATAPGFRALALLPGAGHWVAYEAAGAFDRALLQALQAGPAAAADRR